MAAIRSDSEREIDRAPRSGSTQRLNYRGHIAGLDLVRGAAIFSVLVCHAYDSSTNWSDWHGLARAWIEFTVVGHLGVHLFFMLSGFLITGILVDSKHRALPVRVRSFFGRRARRILPAYLLLLATLSALHLVTRHFVLVCLFFVVNVGRLVGSRLAEYSVVWSLAVEEQFYLLWPWVVWRCSLKTVVRLIVACLVLTPILRLLLALHGTDTYYKTYANLDYLMYGALVACALRTGQLHGGNIRRYMRWLYAGGVAGLALSACLFMTVHAVWLLLLFNSIGRTPFMALFVAWLLSSVLAHQQEAANLTRERDRPRSGHLAWLTRPLAFLGYISYGLYLVHPLVFRLYDRYARGTVLDGFQQNFGMLSLRGLICLVLAMLLAWLSRAAWESWFLARKVE